ncbi:hypothetical protein H4S07_001480 [Coemansia furcata]|uniref:Uncharacterized protein n=1 Tax=Coemansia furcata TaxID=417177 RepID=A0ACC1LNB9_9FUNG|nr:hypothetical protein H4S07_001480 [Coemansia furcata]
MDITSDFRSLVRRHASKQQAQLPVGEKSIERFDVLPPKRANLSQPTGNLFLAEAYIIARHLNDLRVRIVDIRPAYLNLQTRHKQAAPRHTGATAAGKQGLGRLAPVRLTDPERDEIDRGIKTAVRQMLSKIQSLNEVGEAELESFDDTVSAGVLLRRLVGALDPRKAGGHGAETGTRPELTPLGRRDTLAAHQSSVVWWLNSTLQKTNKVHAEMQELHLRQKLERQRGALSQARAQPTVPSHSVQSDVRENDEMLRHLSEQELQQLQMENNNMVQEFESALDKIRETQRSVLEISTLQTQLATEMDAQMQQTERLYNDAVGALDAVGQGNDYLVSARKHQSSARKWVLIILFVLSLVLLFLDWFD